MPTYGFYEGPSKEQPARRDAKRKKYEAMGLSWSKINKLMSKYKFNSGY